MRILINIIYRITTKKHFYNFIFQKESKYSNNCQLIHLKGLKGCLLNNDLDEKSVTMIQIPNFKSTRN